MKYAGVDPGLRLRPQDGGKPPKARHVLPVPGPDPCAGIGERGSHRSADQPTAERGGKGQAQKRLSAGEPKLRRFQEAIEAGVDPAALVEGMNKAHAERAAVRAQLDNAPEPTALTDADVYAMIDSYRSVRRGPGRLGQALRRAAA